MFVTLSPNSTAVSQLILMRSRKKRKMLGWGGINYYSKMQVRVKDSTAQYYQWPTVKHELCVCMKLS